MRVKMMLESAIPRQLVIRTARPTYLLLSEAHINIQHDDMYAYQTNTKIKLQTVSLDKVTERERPLTFNSMSEFRVKTFAS